MERWIIVIFNIILPTIDTVTDLNLIYKLFWGVYYCKNESDDYENCLADPDGPDGYCSNDRNNKTVCGFSSHPKMGTAMLAPFLLNYIVCFITFLRKEKNQIFAFIFALLNFYPQLGMNNQIKNHGKLLFLIFQRPPG